MYVCKYMYVNLAINAIVRHSHPRSEDSQSQDKNICLSLFVMLCAIWYHLRNLKNVKNTHGIVLFLVKLQVSAWQQITQMVPNRAKHHIYTFTYIFSKMLLKYLNFFGAKTECHSCKGLLNITINYAPNFPILTHNIQPYNEQKRKKKSPISACYNKHYI